MNTVFIEYGSQRIKMEWSEAEYMHRALGQALGGSAAAGEQGSVATIDVKGQQFTRHPETGDADLTDC